MQLLFVYCFNIFYINSITDRPVLSTLPCIENIRIFLRILMINWNSARTNFIFVKAFIYWIPSYEYVAVKSLCCRKKTLTQKSRHANLVSGASTKIAAN